VGSKTGWQERNNQRYFIEVTFSFFVGIKIVFQILNSTFVKMKIFQQYIQLRERRRGFHLITSEILQSFPQITELETGMCQVFIQHTSASLSINENADPSVRKDFEYFFNKSVPENDKNYIHSYEGGDDMPAHLKATLIGSSVLIPIHNGKLALGTWQGIYLCEHRNHGGERNIIITAWGE
jgi:secondary thiamine-phosphate synthase enzyme